MGQTQGREMYMRTLHALFLILAFMVSVGALPVERAAEDIKDNLISVIMEASQTSQAEFHGAGGSKPYLTKTITWGSKSEAECKWQCNCKGSASGCDSKDKCKRYAWDQKTKKCELFDTVVGCRMTLAGGRKYLNKHPPKCSPTSEKHSVRCCSKSGDPRVMMDKYGCNPGRTFSGAQKICSAKSLRLCTQAEIKAGKTEGTGCGYDEHRVWTSSHASNPAPKPKPTPKPRPAHSHNPHKHSPHKHHSHNPHKHNPHKHNPHKHSTHLIATKTITWSNKAESDCKWLCEQPSGDSAGKCKSYRFYPTTKKCELFDKCIAETKCITKITHTPFMSKTIDWKKNPTEADCKWQCECSASEAGCDAGARCKSYLYHAATKKCELFDKCTAQTKCVTKTTTVTLAPVWTPACKEAEKPVCANFQATKHCGLTYEIWTDGTKGCMTNTARGFTAKWNHENSNYLARKGVRPGSRHPVVTYSAHYHPTGVSFLGVYGWTKNPLIEYYLVDSWGDWPPQSNTPIIGTVKVDGGTYNIHKDTRVNKPSIEGTKTFTQFWSVRTSKRTSGTITVAPHFDAFARFGLKMGSFYEVSLVVEGYKSSGSADVTVSFK